MTNVILRRDIAILQQRISKGLIHSLDRVTSKDMLADILTKRGVDRAAISTVLETGKVPSY